MEKFETREWAIFENHGQKLFGMIHRPLISGPVPAVVMCHGFAGNKVGRHRIYVQLAQSLAKAGIASLRFDFRGSGDSEGEFADMTIEEEVSDAMQALDFLRKDRQVDSSRIGLLGNSFGGAIAVLAAHRDQNVRSLVLLAALFNCSAWKKRWELMLANKADDVARREVMRIMEGHAPGPGFVAGFFQLDLERQLADLQDIPILHIHSEKDERVGIDQAEQYRRCREHAKAETRWIRLQQSDHDFGNSEERALLVQETAQWFSRTL